MRRVSLKIVLMAMSVTLAWSCFAEEAPAQNPTISFEKSFFVKHADNMPLKYAGAEGLSVLAGEGVNWPIDREFENKLYKAFNDSCLDRSGHPDFAKTLPNAKAKSGAQSAAVDAGIAAGVEMGKAMILSKQAQTLGSLKTVEPLPPSLTEWQNTVTEMCLVQPEIPECLSWETTRQSLGFNNTTFSLGGNGATSVIDQTTGSRSAFATTPTGDVDRSGVVAPSMGEILAPGSSGGGGLVDTVAAGKVNVGAGGIGGGGSGGGLSLGGASAPSGSGGGSAAAPQRNSIGELGKTSYSGASNFIGYGKGGAASSQNRDTSGNPFDRLLGKATGTVDNGFRAPASDSKDIASKEGKNLFDMISGRYQSVSKDRLLEYKAVP